MLLVRPGCGIHALRPGTGGAGPSATFFDYSFTTIIVFAFVVVAVVIWSFSQVRRTKSTPRSSNYFVSTLMFIATAFLIAYLLKHSHFLERFQQLAQQSHQQKPGAGGARPGLASWCYCAPLPAVVTGDTRPPLRSARLIRRGCPSHAVDTTWMWHPRHIPREITGRIGRGGISSNTLPRVSGRRCDRRRSRGRASIQSARGSHTGPKSELPNMPNMPYG